MLDHLQHALWAVQHYAPTLRNPVVLQAIQVALEWDVELRVADCYYYYGTQTDTASSDDRAQKLDQLMLLLFRYIQNYPRSSYTHLYEFLISVFDKYIISTHKSTFVQFLLLVVIAHDDDDNCSYYRDFCRRLLHVLVDPERATVTRQTAACYLASLVSRCTVVDANTAHETVVALLRCAETYLQESDGNEDEHILFYTICQSAFYIVCFRGHELLSATNNNEEEDSIVNPERWSRICHDKLQPLEHCLESVRDEFTRLADQYHLLPQAPTPRRPRRKRGTKIVRRHVTLEQQRREGGVGGLGQGTNPLDSFFPFDPYLLRESYAFVEPLYRHWNGGGEGDEMEHDNDELPSVENVDVEQAAEGHPSCAEDDEEDGHDHAEQEEVTEIDQNPSDDEQPSSKRRKRLLSVTSNATSVSSAPEQPEKQPLWKKWKETLRRSRAESVETFGDDGDYDNHNI